MRGDGKRKMERGRRDLGDGKFFLLTVLIGKHTNMSKQAILLSTVIRKRERERERERAKNTELIH